MNCANTLHREGGGPLAGGEKSLTLALAKELISQSNIYKKKQKKEERFFFSLLAQSREIFFFERGR